ncbi:adenylate/guanylate cyclase domain-containing protein, partial [Gaiella sp.]|uniref:adenylate/guanylate cyclase domain-containing protein n=1 Tax=Gaiella sp. TaxID=2663207 RepID=UPI002BD1724B
MGACPACGTANADTAKFCSECGAALAAVRPAARREERKVVSVVFTDLVGSTARAEESDPEDVRALLRVYHERARDELERRGGTVEKFIGDAVVAVFGAPVAHEDDPERAVRAALAVRDAVAALNEEQPGRDLHVRIAVNTGAALVSLDAVPGEGEAMVAGDVMNTAARLQSAAPVDGIVVGEQTYRATEREIVYREAEPVQAKGKSQPVPVWEAVEPRGRLGVDLGGSVGTELVGRDDEVDLLVDALRRSRRDRTTQLVTLVGVPGIGKSRLVLELG